MRARFLTLNVFAILLILAATGVAAVAGPSAREVATRSLSAPGVETRIMLVSPETYWADIQSRLSDSETATREFQTTWPHEEMNGLQIEVAVRSGVGPLDVDWKASRLQIGDGTPLEPVAVSFPKAFTPGEWTTGHMWFDVALQSITGQLTLVTPRLVPAAEAGHIEWTLPLDYPAEIKATLPSLPSADSSQVAGST